MLSSMMALANTGDTVVKNHWLKNIRKTKLKIQIVGTDQFGTLHIINEPFAKDFEWESTINRFTIDSVEVIDGNDFPVWSNFFAALPTLSIGDILRIDFSFIS